LANACPAPVPAEPVRPEQLSFSAQDLRHTLHITANLLESLRFECSRTSNGLGAVGIGGILTGSRSGSELHIQAIHPIACAHALGPQFRLSPIEEASLAAQLDGLSYRPGSQVLAWFCTHPKGGNQLTEEEAELHARFFAPYSPLLLIADPDPFGSLEIAVHEPLEHPTWQLHRSSELWHVDPLPTARRQRAAEARQPRPKPQVVPPPARPAAPPARPYWHYPAIALALCLTLSAAVLLYLRQRPTGPAPTAASADAPIEMVSLHAGDSNGRLVVSWNPQSATVQVAQRAEITLTEGSSVRRHPISPAQLRAGSATFTRTSPRVHIRLVLLGASGQSFEEETHFAAAERAIPLPPEMRPPSAR